MQKDNMQPTRQKRWIFFGILAACLAFVLSLTVYKISVANAYRVFAVDVKPIELADSPLLQARGAHLVRDVLGCPNCHGQDLGGKMLPFAPQTAVIAAPNLTTPRSDADWVRALRYGVDSENRGLWLMPTRAHSALSDSDLSAVVAYIRHLPVQQRVLAQSHLGWRGILEVTSRRLRLLQTRPSRLADNAQAPPIAISQAYGAYIYQIANCGNCHQGPGAVGPGDPLYLNAPSLDGRTLGWDVPHLVDSLVRTSAHNPDLEHIHSIPHGGWLRLNTIETQALWRYLKTL